MIDDARIQVFIAAARDFCHWCSDRSGIIAPGTVRMTACGLLVRLYAAGLNLPDRDTPAESELDCGNASQISPPCELPRLPFDYYQCFCVPEHLDERPGIGSLSDDLYDILHDLREGFVAFDQGRVEAAVWTWRWSWLNHWGEHAVQALNALHDRSPHSVPA